MYLLANWITSCIVYDLIAVGVFLNVNLKSGIELEGPVRPVNRCPRSYLPSRVGEATNKCLADANQNKFVFTIFAFRMSRLSAMIVCDPK